MKIFDRKYAGVLLLTPKGEVVLQQRDNTPGIVNPGMVTTFGGGVESGETPYEALVRELQEELNLQVDNSELVMVTNKIKEVHGEDCTLFIFKVENVDPNSLAVSEGKGFVVIKGKKDMGNYKLSLKAKEILEEWFEMGEGKE